MRDGFKFKEEERSCTDVIYPIPEDQERPLWSVMIPAYNCASYLVETLKSVLCQDPGPKLMQIQVVDDASTQDDPAQVVEMVAKGRVGYFRQPQNVGHVRNFNTCLKLARGHLIHILHGDDAVKPGFYQKMHEPFVELPGIGAAFCRDIRIDEDGQWNNLAPLIQNESGVIPNWLEMIAVGQRLQTPAMVVRREVYEKLGGYDNRITSYGEDWEMWVRIASQYPVWYEVEPLALYRIRASGLSGRTMRTGENARQVRLVIDLNRSHLPKNTSDRWSKMARKNLAEACLRRAHRMLNGGVTDGVLAQARESFRSGISFPLIFDAVYLFARWSYWKARAYALVWNKKIEKVNG